MARYLISTIGVNTGAIDVKRQVLEAFWSRERQCIKMAGTSRRWVNYVEVNKQQRRDVSASYTSQSLKAKRGTRIRGIGDRTN